MIIRRNFALGENLADARDELGRLKALNKGKFDWDLEKKEKARAKVKALTLGEWLDQYLDLVKDTPSGPTKKAQAAHLKRLLGNLPLADVTKVRVLEFKKRRLSEPLVRYGKKLSIPKSKARRSTERCRA